MKIVWNENPLCSSIILDDRDREVFKLKLYIEELENKLVGCHFYLTDSEYFNLDEAKKSANYNFEEIQEALVDKFDYLVKELEFGTHIGDCTCLPCSCEKCFAENLLGINTMEGLGKHEAYKIDSFFYDRKTQKVIRNINEVLEALQNYEPNANWEGAEVHFKRWKQEANRAYEWLKKYKEEHDL